MLIRKTWPYGLGVFTGSYEHEALTPSMANSLTIPLTAAFRETMANQGGDFIDTGLALVQALRNQGFEVRLITPDSEQ